jgi:hypothetical protein
MKGKPLIVADGATVTLLNGDYIFPNSIVWVTPPGDMTVKLEESDYGNKWLVPMTEDFGVESKYIKSIGGTDGGAKRKHVPLDKCTVAELKAKRGQARA